MSVGLWQGKLVRLTAPEPEITSRLLSRWWHNSEYGRMLDADPVRLWPVQAVREYVEKEDVDKSYPNSIHFLIRPLDHDEPIGHIGFSGIAWAHGSAWVAVGIGDPAFWSKGYGSDAMRVLLRYGFCELNLRRVTLNVFEYNRRAIRAYEKLGFVVEGRGRGMLKRDGRRWDMIFMGLLVEEWKEQCNGCANTGI